MSLKPLGIVKEILESIGIEISYAYDDLVFVNHNAFLLQFADNKDQIILHVNCETEEDVIQSSITAINNACALRNVELQFGRYYSLKQADGENLRLEFQDMKEPFCYGGGRQ